MLAKDHEEVRPQLSEEFLFKTIHLKKLKCTPTGRGEKKRVCIIVYPFKTNVVSMIYSTNDLTVFLNVQYLTSRLVFVFFFLKEEPFHFSCTIHVIISRLSEHFAMIFSTESLGE